MFNSIIITLLLGAMIVLWWQCVAILRKVDEMLQDVERRNLALFISFSDAKKYYDNAFSDTKKYYDDFFVTIRTIIVEAIKNEATANNGQDTGSQMEGETSSVDGRSGEGSSV